MKSHWLAPDYEQDLVSVIIPCHNEERFLPACLKSLVDQKYRPLEIIMVDDGSTDNTSEIMKYFANQQNGGISVKCLYQTQKGAPNARNHGCAHAHGEFIQFIDGDDLLFPEKLVEQIAALNSDNQVDVVYGDGQYLIGLLPREFRTGELISMGPSPDIIASLLYGSWVPLFSYLSRRSAVRRCGPWDDSLPVLQDRDYFLRMALCGFRFSYREGINGFYRKYSHDCISEKSASLRGRTYHKLLASAELDLRQHGQLNQRRVSAMVECYRRIARQTFSTDTECFKNSVSHVLRLCPHYRPEKARARLVSSLIGYRNYEIFAAIISIISHRLTKHDVSQMLLTFP